MLVTSLHNIIYTHSVRHIHRRFEMRNEKMWKPRVWRLHWDYITNLLISKIFFISFCFCTKTKHTERERERGEGEEKNIIKHGFPKRAWTAQRLKPYQATSHQCHRSDVRAGAHHTHQHTPNHQANFVSKQIVYDHTVYYSM